MNYDKKKSDEIFEMYKTKEIGRSQNCIKCKEVINNRKDELFIGPVPIFHIGKNFSNAETRLLIVGMVPYGWDDIIENFEETWSKIFEGDYTMIEFMQDKIEVRTEELFRKGETRYYSFLKYALSGVYGDIDAAFDNIAITNFVHCNTGDVSDNLPQKVRTYCCNKNSNGFIHEEIKILNPTHVLCLTVSNKYLRYLKNQGNFLLKGIYHPSSRGNSKEKFKTDISSFLNLELSKIE